jgi:hypothetical protein
MDNTSSTASMASLPTAFNSTRSHFFIAVLSLSSASSTMYITPILRELTAQQNYPQNYQHHQTPTNISVQILTPLDKCLHVLFFSLLFIL